MVKYLEKYKSKKQSWLEMALFFASIIIIFGILIFSSQDKTEGTDGNLFIYLIGALILLWYWNKRRAKPTPKTHEEIINFIADDVYRHKGLYLKTDNNNVKVQRAGVGETYVEFLGEHLTFLYLDGVGIVEKYPGESIKSIQKYKQDDIIQMKLAEIGLAKKRHVDNLEVHELTDEEQA